jgi:hypothetical protein
VYSLIDEITEPLGHGRTHSRKPDGQSVGPQQKKAARLAGIKGLAHATGVAAHYVQLQFSRLRRLNTFRGKTSYAGRDPVNDFSSSNNPFDESAGLSHRPARARREPHAPIFQHDLIKVAASQAVSSELYRGRHHILTKAEIRR